MELKLKNKLLLKELVTSEEPINLVKGTCGGFSIDIDDDSCSSFIYKTEVDRDSDFRIASAFLETFNSKLEYVG
jgi:hypothetical protein